MATERVKVVNIDTAPATKSVKDLRTELKLLKDQMLSTEQGTEEYNAAMKQAAEIQHTLKEQMEEVNASAMDFGQIAGNATKAVGGLVGGLQAAKATMSLLGVENEDVMKSLQKMQNLMAITQALPSIDNGIKAFKRLKIAIQATSVATSSWGKALIATGIGAIVVALGLLIANFDKISAWLDEITGQTDFLGSLSDKVIGGLQAGWAAIVQSLKAVGNAIVTYVTTPFKAVWNAIQAYTSTNGGFADKLKAAGKAMKDGFVSDWKKVGDDFKQVGTVAASAYQKGYEEHKAKRLAKNVEDAKEEGAKEGKAKGTAKAEAEEAAYKKHLKAIDAQEREEMLRLQQMGLNYEEYVQKKQELEDEFTRKRIEALQNILATEQDLKDEEIATLQDELIKLQDSLYKKPEKEESSDENQPSEQEQLAIGLSESLNLAAQSLNDLSTNSAWGDIMNNITQIANIFDDLNKNHIEKGSKEAFGAYVAVAAAGMSAISSLMNGLASEQDATNKEGFEKQKKLQIAGATMSMLAGITAAIGGLFTTKSGPWDIALAAIQAAMISALGIAQIVKIKQQKYDGGGSSGASSSSTPNTSAVAAVTAPVQYTQDVQGASIEGAIKDTKVYVTETDITDTQKKVDVTEQEAIY